MPAVDGELGDLAAVLGWSQRVRVGREHVDGAREPERRTCAGLFTALSRERERGVP
jgi:hypothetical protein